MIKPVNIIHPEGGEPLYEDVSGLRWTAQDFAARYGYESTKAFLDSLKEPMKIYSYSPEEDIDG